MGSHPVEPVKADTFNLHAAPLQRCCCHVHCVRRYSSITAGAMGFGSSLLLFGCVCQNERASIGTAGVDNTFEGGSFVDSNCMNALESACSRTVSKSYVLLQATTFQTIALGAGWGVLLQVIIGLPFLIHYPASYLSRAFELSRVFTHRWSVNLKFLPEPIFQSRSLALLLLASHLVLLYVFAQYRCGTGK